MKTSQDVIVFLTSKGYNPYPPHEVLDEGVTWCAEKRLAEGAPQCQTNGDKVSWHVRVHDWSYDKHVFQEIDIRIFGQSKNVWYELKAYSVPFNKVEQTLQAVEAKLLAAWYAVASN